MPEISLGCILGGHMKKLFVAFLGFVVAANLLVAEESGFFVGGHLGYGTVRSEYYLSYGKRELADTSVTLSGLRYGVLGGYKQFFGGNFGLRYYAMANLGSTDSVDITDYHVNVDAMYNFIDIEQMPLGAFAGLGVGRVNFSGAYGDLSQLDLHIQLGVRLDITANHGVEVFWQDTMTGKTQSQSIGNYFEDKGYGRPMILGVRYTYSF